MKTSIQSTSLYVIFELIEILYLYAAYFCSARIFQFQFSCCELIILFFCVVEQTARERSTVTACEINYNCIYNGQMVRKQLNN